MGNKLSCIMVLNPLWHVSELSQTHYGSWKDKQRNLRMWHKRNLVYPKLTEKDLRAKKTPGIRKLWHSSYFGSFWPKICCMKHSISTKVEYLVMNWMLTESSRLESDRVCSRCSQNILADFRRPQSSLKGERFWSKHSSEGFWGTENNFKGSKGLPSLISKLNLHSS